MNEKLKIALPIIVEGRYDRAALSSIAEATVVTLGGFSVFNSKEKQALIRKLSENGIIVLTDSDGAGKTIRAFLQGIVPKERIYNLYVPQIKGKERRKKTPSKEGLLGVEGMDAELLRDLLKPFGDGGRAELIAKNGGSPVTKQQLYLLGLSGSADASARRALIAESYGLPEDMTANALVDALNVISCAEELEEHARAVLASI